MPRIWLYSVFTAKLGRRGAVGSDLGVRAVLSDPASTRRQVRHPSRQYGVDAARCDLNTAQAAEEGCAARKNR